MLLRFMSVVLQRLGIEFHHVADKSASYLLNQYKRRHTHTVNVFVFTTTHKYKFIRF